ncbi:Hypothetical predicted protein [Paramuricea clavata]|uniref:Uncharacterized protein n=1 Tax=Paramuricea clavata TaxID=317549 RepID=A0A7D9DZA4_PARCT|nr:Hypothetical predicted protein [Paramuricea clavata]
MNRTVELMPDFRRMNKAEITGDRTRHVLTFNSNSARPEEEIYVNIPKLKADSVLVPDNMALVFDFKNSNTKSWFRNNLGKLLQRRLEIRLAGEKVYDNSGESLLEVYKDLWLHRKQRDDMVEDGIASEATRKKIFKDDAANDDVDAAALFEVFGTKQRIRIGKILKDHGLYAPHNKANDLQVTVEGVSNAVYSQGIPKTRLYEEARRLFGTGEISHQTLTNFFKDKKFALVIDLRTVNDVSTFGNGAKIQTTQSGILVEITKKATTANVVCHMFVLSDGGIGIENGQFTGVQY